MDPDMKKIIKRKVNGYYQQDKKIFFTKDSIRPKNYIDVDDVILLLKLQENKCYICNEKVLLTYEKGCKNQFITEIHI